MEVYPTKMIDVKDKHLNYLKINSPIGALYLISEDFKLVAIIFSKDWSCFKRSLANKKLVQNSNFCLKKTESQLNEYFLGRRKVFDLEICLLGTVFQKNAWEQLSQIPHGKTISYLEQALMMKNPKAVRAVGAANGKNPIPIVIPCHRVIGKSGKLTGYAGGLKKKSVLLNLEKSKRLL
jgi:methylated-DNA-[protein]-cysteine S-methyltransferase